MPPGGGLLAALARPANDTLRGLDTVLAGRAPRLAAIGLGLLLAWWIYVPIHELFHAWACLLAGGEVTRLEVAPLYGGHLLAAVVPFVVAGGDYAGRLSGFDTGGSDLVYLATDFGPYLLTVFPGVWWLRRAARRGRPLLFGAALPVALAPFVSLPGDAYEIGSILATRLPPWRGMSGVLRGDDVTLVAARVGEAAASPWGGFAVAIVLGIAWALATYGLGAVVARLAGEPALADPRGKGTHHFSPAAGET